MNRLLSILSSLAVFVTGAGISAALNAATLDGIMETGTTPINGATVVLYQAGNAIGAPATILASDETGLDGGFTLDYVPPVATDVIYLIASGGIPPIGSEGLTKSAPTPDSIRLAAILGQAGDAPGFVIINERTTVAAAWSMAQFMNGSTVAGPSPGLQIAAASGGNLVDVTTGEVAAMLANYPNGTETITYPKFNTLANILAGCVSSETIAPCNELFSLSGAAGCPEPTDTLQAALNIAHNPVDNTLELFLLSLTEPTYMPALDEAPRAWEIFLKYIGNGSEFDGPGNIAIDKDGNLWITNNFVFDSNPGLPGLELLAIKPTGEDLPGAPFSGGGISGAGLGICVDTTGCVWVGNFGFGEASGFGDSVSKFDSVGNPISPATGFTEETIYGVQGVISDYDGNIWIAGYGNSKITKYPGGDNTQAVTLSGMGIDKPFDIAIDREGNAVATSSGGDSLVALAPDGTPLAGSPYHGGGLSNPLGLAIDSQGNIWVSNFLGHSVSWFDPDGQPHSESPFTAHDTIIGPWGIAVDGNDDIYVAGFLGTNLTVLRGVRKSSCHPDVQTGEPLSPPGGYRSKVLTRLTGVEIDAAGNVWVANNFKKNVFEPPNYGGDSLLQFVGMAAPVKCPLIGPPASPSPTPEIIPTPTPLTTPEYLVLGSGDYNGDGLSDIAVFRQSAGLWAIKDLGRIYFGKAGDIPVSGDYDGDGSTDVSIFRPSTGLWAIKAISRLYFGGSDDIPVPADYNGDGSCDIAVFGNTSGRWAVKGISRNYFGASGDLPVPADYDADGSANIAIFRQQFGLWAVRNFSRYYFGISGDIPLPGVYSWFGPLGPLQSQSCIFRSSSGLWAIRGQTVFWFGTSEDSTVIGSFNGDILDDPGIFRPENGLWAIRGVSKVYFGMAGDIPVTR